MTAFLDTKQQEAELAGPVPAPAPRLLGEFLFAGGKRLRPLLCVTGWWAGGGRGMPAQVVSVAAGLEMFHAFALIHDDLMDGSQTRRGRPVLHRVLATELGHGTATADASRLGVSVAILFGDLALTWADELMHTAAITPDQLARVTGLVDAMRGELVYGQFLDLTSAGQPTRDVAKAMRIARYKTAGYTVERPLHLGAALAGAGTDVMAACSAIGLPLGEAFQLRDDLLGVFGDPQETGKSCEDDLRDGKHTALVCLAFERADASQHAALASLIGNPALGEDEARHVRALLTATGAREEVERMIRTRCDQARRALDQARFPPVATTALHQIVDTATVRTR
nr:polyprenyl synthetase family protein [Streptomyces yunnanensis]